MRTLKKDSPFVELQLDVVLDTTEEGNERYPDEDIVAPRGAR
jgi:hypothetical protein